MENLIGVILCGGESKRMGTDKGLLPIRNTIRAKYIHEKLSAFHMPVVYSVNQRQLESYREHISQEFMVVDNSEVQGPLNGILSVMQKYPGFDLLLMACDMLDLDGATIEQLIKEYSNDKSYDFYVYQDTDFAQPFCGIYTSVGLAKVEGRIMIGRVQNYSLQAILDEGYTKRLTIRNKNAFRSYDAYEK